MTNPTCSISDCDRAVKARGYCSRHYYRLLHYRNPTGGGVIREHQSGDCAIHDCLKPARSRGYCHAHYCRLNKYGDPLGTKNDSTIQPTCTWGDTKGNKPCTRPVFNKTRRLCRTHANTGSKRRRHQRQVETQTVETTCTWGDIAGNKPCTRPVSNKTRRLCPTHVAHDTRRRKRYIEEREARQAGQRARQAAAALRTRLGLGIATLLPTPAPHVACAWPLPADWKQRTTKHQGNSTRTWYTEVNRLVSREFTTVLARRGLTRGPDTYIRIIPGAPHPHILAVTTPISATRHHVDAARKAARTLIGTP